MKQRRDPKLVRVHRRSHGEPYARLRADACALAQSLGLAVGDEFEAIAPTVAGLQTLRALEPYQADMALPAVESVSGPGRQARHTRIVLRARTSGVTSRLMGPPCPRARPARSSSNATGSANACR